MAPLPLTLPAIYILPLSPLPHRRLLSGHSGLPCTFIPQHLLTQCPWLHVPTLPVHWVTSIPASTLCSRWHFLCGCTPGWSMAPRKRRLCFMLLRGHSCSSVGPPRTLAFFLHSWVMGTTNTCTSWGKLSLHPHSWGPISSPTVRRTGQHACHTQHGTSKLRPSLHRRLFPFPGC